MSKPVAKTLVFTVSVLVLGWLVRADAVDVSATLMPAGNTGQAARTTSLTPFAVAVDQATDEVMLFRATFTNNGSRGELVAYRLDRAASSLRISWHASDRIPESRKRNIYTINNAGLGVPFVWNALDMSARHDIGSAAVLRHIRGYSGIAHSPSGGLGARMSRLGAIVHSTPAVAGDQGFGYGILPGAAGASYRAYVVHKRQTPNVVLFGASDGMLHAVGIANGRERFAYIPRQLFASLKALVNPGYSHHFYVDGSPVIADAYWGETWRTVAITTLGRGGKSVFALDLTHPASLDAATTVLWELSPAAGSAAYGYLGVAMGRAAVVRVESGDWVVLLGNGYNSVRGTAALLVVELATGAILEVLDTGVGGDNGLAAPLAIDRDRNGSVDTVYAGDLQGNLWKFDFSADSSIGWRIAYGATPMVTAVADHGARQPITSRADAIAHPLGGVLLVFGTGRHLSMADANRTTEQSIYGVWDSAGAGLDSDGDAVLNQPLAGIARLVEQTVRLRTRVSGRDVRVLTQKSIDYGTNEGEHRGWVVDLTRSRERILQAVRIVDGKAIMVTRIPDTPAGSPDADSALIQLNPLTGSQFQQPTLDLDGDGEFDLGDGVAGADDRPTLYPASIDLNVGLASTPILISGRDGRQILLVGGSNLNRVRFAQKSFLRTGRAAWVQRR